MASSAAPARPPRRPASVSSVATNPAQRSPPAPSPNPSGTTLVGKGSISRSSPTPKVPPPVRRSTANSRPSSSLSNPRDSLKDVSRAKSPENGSILPTNGQENDAEIGSNDELRLRIQDLDSTVSSLAAENAKLQTSLTQIENRLTEVYADQARMDNELAVRHELAEKLRAQIREFEKEKRELTRRYNEQTAAFEAERQSFYDNEQHLKSRIQALSQTRKEQSSPRKLRHAELDDNISIVSEAEFPPHQPQPQALSNETKPAPQGMRRRGETIKPTNAHYDSEDNEPAEMTALKLELTTLSTSHASLQSTLHLLQSQLQDLKRVNSELQEENEGWKVLVQQRTLAGTFDILGLGGAQREPQDKEKTTIDDTSSMKSGRNALEKVSEMDEIAYEAEIRGSLDGELARSEANAARKRDDSPESRHSKRRRNTGSSDPDGAKGESLADLPITGPGLDLAAELGRAQNAEGFIDGQMRSTNQKQLTAEEKRLKSENDSLRSEVKNLKDANKALSLYASKIINRIIATEGFENVLAVDFQDRGNKQSSDPEPKRARPGSLMFGVGGVLPDGARNTAPTEKLTTFESIGLSGPAVTAPAPSNITPAATPSRPKPTTPADDPRRSRRSMSFDWRGFSLFGGSGPTEAEKKANDPSLRPLTLRPGAPPLTSTPTTARKLETMEDEEDRRERERLRATMRLMGIDPAKEQPSPAATDYTYTPQRPMDSSLTTSSQPLVSPTPQTAVPAAGSNRWSWFGRRNTNETSTSASASTSSISISPSPGAPLTAEALQQAEAESHLAALDAREKIVKEEIAKGSASGFTELSGFDGGPRRRIGEEWRSRRNSPNFASADLLRSNSSRKPGSSAGSASTVWSAGKDDD
ncbi:hypothetical protein FRC17_000408 [Serendipita sp. 399]|nr:hypothetical protein FRC17_000408 [Serendipita sp. 399]